MPFVTEREYFGPSYQKSIEEMNGAGAIEYLAMMLCQQVAQSRASISPRWPHLDEEVKKKFLAQAHALVENWKQEELTLLKHRLNSLEG